MPRLRSAARSSWCRQPQCCCTHRINSSPNKVYRTIQTPTHQLYVLGDLLTIASRIDDLYDWMASECVRVDGEPLRLRILGQPNTIIFSLPEAMEAITTTYFHQFPKGLNQIEIISTLFGRGLLASNGERWFHQRKTAVQFFSAKVLRTFLAESVHKTLGRITTLLDASIAEKQSVDLQKMFHDFTLDTFVEMALGVDFNCISSMEVHPFQAALDGASPITSSRASRPKFMRKLERWLGVGAEGQLATYAATMQDWLSNVIQESMDNRSAAQANPSLAGEPTVKNVVELFFELSKDSTDGLQKEDLIDFVLTFVVAARDTTADTLGWFFYALAQRPEIEAKLRKEMTEKLSLVAHDTCLTPDHMRDLVYMEACIKETPRLYPAVPFTFREVVEDTVICGDIALKKGELVGIAQYAMGRLPRVCGDDAAEFKPERWIDVERKMARSSRCQPRNYFHLVQARARASARNSRRSNCGQ